jgi:ATP-binding cassette, subfamily C (CFTR/MRP), member 1
MYYTIQFLTLTRGSLVALLFDKALYGNSKASGDSVSATITLLNSDMERINLGVQQMHNTWACIIEVGISTWLLARQLGISALACLLFSLRKCTEIILYMDFLTPNYWKVCLVLANIVAIKATRRLKIWLKAIERRVNFTTRIVNQYRSVKMAGLSNLLQTKLLGYRNEEIKMSKTYRKYDVAIFGLSKLLLLFLTMSA